MTFTSFCAGKMGEKKTHVCKVQNRTSSSWMCAEEDASSCLGSEALRNACSYIMSIPCLNRVAKANMHISCAQNNTMLVALLKNGRKVFVMKLFQHPCHESVINTVTFSYCDILFLPYVKVCKMTSLSGVTGVFGVDIARCHMK